MRRRLTVCFAVLVLMWAVLPEAANAAGYDGTCDSGENCLARFDNGVAPIADFTIGDTNLADNLWPGYTSIYVDNDSQSARVRSSAYQGWCLYLGYGQTGSYLYIPYAFVGYYTFGAGDAYRNSISSQRRGNWGTTVKTGYTSTQSCP